MEKIDTKNIIEGLLKLGATISEAKMTDGELVYTIDINSIENIEARNAVSIMLEEIATKENGKENTSNEG